MARQFKPVRFFVLMALLAFIVCGVTAFYTQRAAHGRTPEERVAYSLGEQAGSEAAPNEKLPAAWEMNEIAEQFLKKETKKKEPMAWKSAFEKGYTDGFEKTHPGP